MLPQPSRKIAHLDVMSTALDEVALPVAGELPILNLRRAHMDAHHVRDLTSAVLSFAARHALVVGLAQGGDQLAHGLGVDAVVDARVRRCWAQTRAVALA
jgi:hypothetical protein